MQKKVLYFLIALMSLSLAGIIAVQIYWVTESIHREEERFALTIQQLLKDVTEEIANQEYDYYYNEIKKEVEKRGLKPSYNNYFKILIDLRDVNETEKSNYFRSDIGKNKSLRKPYIDISFDSLTMSRLYDTNNSHVTGSITDPLKSYTTYRGFNELDDYERRVLRNKITLESNRLPITQRVSNSTIIQLIERELDVRQVDVNFEFAIYESDFPTRIQSLDFKLDKEATWSFPLFDSGKQVYKLYIYIPERNKIILSSVIGIALLSFIFTLIIVIAYSSAISQLFALRQISQIKTDFINNMTHEFKTPISTINLAIDSIKHPKVISNKERVLVYLKMIQEENKRMHSQVENVLQISKLERNVLNIEKSVIDVHATIKSSISHIELILSKRNGVLNTHFDATITSVLANESHLGNVFVNILDNAIKYTAEDQSPVINIYTANIRDKIIIRITDQGIGMSKPVQQKIFKKFYRAHTGNIHNVKGHGLGLSYVARIIKDLNGKVYVESVKDQGSEFIINLPIIT